MPLHERRSKHPAANVAASCSARGACAREHRFEGQDAGVRQRAGMSPELQRISRLSAARRRSVADAGGPTPCASHRTTSSGSARMPPTTAASERPGVDYLRETNPGPCVRPCISYHGGRGCHVATSDPIAEIIGDYRAFAAMQRDRLLARGIDIAPYPLSHLAVRVADWDLYVHQRTLLERHARANPESDWNGRPISFFVLAEPPDVLDGTPVSRIELIPPVHQRVYRMGLEHLGVVVGEEIDEFSRVHRAALTGQQFQSPEVEPVYVLFEDFTHVKFYRRSFFDVVEDEGGRFDGFSHVDDWVPQRLVTATGPNSLPR